MGDDDNPSGITSVIWVSIGWRHDMEVLSALPTHHNNDVIMSTVASQITSPTIVYSIVYSDADQRKHQSPASLAFVREIHRWPVNSPHKGPVTRNIFPFDDVIMRIPNRYHVFERYCYMCIFKLLTMYGLQTPREHHAIMGGCFWFSFCIVQSFEFLHPTQVFIHISFLT